MRVRHARCSNRACQLLAASHAEAAEHGSSSSHAASSAASHAGGCAWHWRAHGGNVCLQLPHNLLQALHLALQSSVLSLK
jgi:hypothetical protein